MYFFLSHRQHVFNTYYYYYYHYSIVQIVTISCNRGQWKYMVMGEKYYTVLKIS